ncbi:hypothetical protein QW180_04790 [Vibrio sinaloensis]|nr:hypothetical protein [Vibrio sinaloensis]
MIEFMVASTVGIIALGVMGSLFINSQKNSSTAHQRAEFVTKHQQCFTDDEFGYEKEQATTE